MIFRSLRGGFQGDAPVRPPVAILQYSIFTIISPFPYSPSRYSLSPGKNVTYICRDGKTVAAEGGDSRRSVQVTCGGDGHYNLPQIWPVCK